MGGWVIVASRTAKLKGFQRQGKIGSVM